MGKKTKRRTRIKMQREQQSFFDVQLLAGAFNLAFVLDD